MCLRGTGILLQWAVHSRGAELSSAGICNQPTAGVGSSRHNSPQRSSQHLSHQHLSSLPPAPGVGVCWHCVDGGEPSALPMHLHVCQMNMQNAMIIERLAQACRLILTYPLVREVDAGPTP